MAFSVTKAEKLQLKAKRTDAEFAWKKYVEAMHAAQDALEAYNERRADLLEVVEEIGKRMREDFNDKSEAWQEGERGEAAGEFIGQWEDVQVDEPDDLSVPGDEEPVGAVIDELPEEE